MGNTIDINTEFNLNLPGVRRTIIPARFQKRLLALAIDFFILEVFVFSILVKPLQKYFSHGLSGLLADLQALNPAYLMFFVSSASLLMLLYFSLLDFYAKGTPGKLLVGIRVSSPSLLSSFIRNLSSVLIFPFNWIFVIDIYFLFTKKYRWLEQFSDSYSYEVVDL